MFIFLNNTLNIYFLRFIYFFYLFNLFLIFCKFNYKITDGLFKFIFFIFKSLIKFCFYVINHKFPLYIMLIPFISKLYAIGYNFILFPFFTHDRIYLPIHIFQKRRTSWPWIKFRTIKLPIRNKHPLALMICPAPYIRTI